MLANVTYEVEMALLKGTSYFGRTVAKFVYTDTKQPLFIDYHGSKVNKLVINGNEIKNIDKTVFDGNRVRFESKFLKNGQENKVEINFLNNYRNDGDGLHSFIDKSDNQQYLYTHLEPEFCHYVMPVFDQPDLRAAWTFTSLIPNDWNVVSNEREYTPESNQGA